MWLLWYIRHDTLCFSLNLTWSWWENWFFHCDLSKWLLYQNQFWVWRLTRAVNYLLVQFRTQSSNFVLLPCQWKYWHRAKIDFEMRPHLGCATLKISRKMVFDNPSVCLSVRPSVLLSLFPRALTAGVRVNRSIWNFRGMFGYMGLCVVPIFEAIHEPFYKIRGSNLVNGFWLACENLSNYYPIVIKFSGYLLLYKDTSAIDFGHDSSTRL